MPERPKLSDVKDSETLRRYYYLLEELKAYCRERGLPASGSKGELTERIAHYLDTGEIQHPRKRAAQSQPAALITSDTRIEPHIKCSEAHRAFFKGKIGKGFSFNVPFQNWLKKNNGKTYGEAVDAYRTLKAAAKTGKTTISKQFEYNTYIRDFYAANRDHSLRDAIRCWKHKKDLPGHNRYEPEDLAALQAPADQEE